MIMRNTKHPKISIAIRFALLSWLVSLATLFTFVLTTLPQQKKTFIENLESKANGVVVSLHDVAAGAAINEDFASVINASQTLLDGDPDLDFLIVTKNGGVSLINEQAGWRVETETNAYWQPQKREPVGEIATVPMFDRRVFHYAQPFDYSGIEWGWIHVGLSLKGYDQSVSTMYRNTVAVGVGCIFLGLFISLVYGRQMVRPILRLRHFVQKIAGGDLSVRADIHRNDELGSLAESVNTMTEALLRRDSILESVRFAAQQFLQLSQWEESINDVLSKIGQSAGVSRAYLFKNHTDNAGRLYMSQRNEWSAQGVSPQLQNPDLQNISYEDAGFQQWGILLGRNENVIGTVSKMSAREQALLEPQDIRSLIIIPIFVEGDWWGFMGLDDCVQERTWTDAEQDSLRAAADMLGATIGRQRVQNALLVAKEGAEEANRTKSEFLANMSHELRTPLNHIIGFTELITGNHFGELNETQAEYLNDVLKSSRHLLSLINDVLDLSKVEAGKLELNCTQVDLQHLLENSLIMVKEKAMKHSLKLSCKLGELPDTIQADERKLKQVIYNLLSNAVKFTPDGGDIILSAEIANGKSNSRNADDARPEAAGPWISISVRDTGIGLKQEDLSRVFSPFEQVESSRSRKFQGTGLGLSLVMKLVALHGGEIWAESEGEGKGCVFTLGIPANLQLAAEVF